MDLFVVNIIMESYLRGFNGIFEEYLTPVIVVIPTFTLNGRKQFFEKMSESNDDKDLKRREQMKDRLINCRRLAKWMRKDFDSHTMPLVLLISLILLLCTSTTFADSLPLIGLPGVSRFRLTLHITCHFQ